MAGTMTTVMWFNRDDPELGAMGAVLLLSLFAMLLLWSASTPLRNALRAGRTCYAVTTDRVVILDNVFGWRAVSIRPAEFARVTRYDLDGDRGSVRLRFSRRGNLFGMVHETGGLTDGLWGTGTFGAAMLAVHRLMESVGR